MPTVAVFFGGRSNESEVSVITGMLVCNLLRGGSYRVLPVWLPPEGGMGNTFQDGLAQSFFRPGCLC